jgi:hypothetical protein
MVQLHAHEHDVIAERATRDIDVLGQARPPGTLARIDAALDAAGFRALDPDLDGYAHRYERDGLIVDVLAPDGIRPPAQLGGGRKAIEAPGGSQALARSERVAVRMGELSFELRRPTLVSAILIKGRAVLVHADPDAQREDLLRLLALVDDPRALGIELKRSERRWLTDAEAALGTGTPTTLPTADVRRARQALTLLRAG